VHRAHDERLDRDVAVNSAIDRGREQALPHKSECGSVYVATFMATHSTRWCNGERGTHELAFDTMAQREY
jgi:hypothetical protein